MQDRTPLQVVEQYASVVDAEMKELLSSYPDFEMYKMILYFMGFLDENLRPVKSYGGKRFRAGICMMLADFYGHAHDSLEAATAIELFHNFTLIHDDVADRDEYRRGRETVWKKWGINQALNTGDVLMMLVYAEVNKLTAVNPKVAEKVNVLMNKRFIEVVEGQHLDFSFSDLTLDDSRLSEEIVLDMLGRKSGVLVALPAEVAGVVSGVSEAELGNLQKYGYNLGVTYQLCDDIISVWGDKTETGKDNLADIREKKKTWPILHLYKNSTEDIRNELLGLYSKTTDLTITEIARVKELLDESGAKSYVLAKAKETLGETEKAIAKLSLSEEQKQKLHDINTALFPILSGGK